VDDPTVFQSWTSKLNLADTRDGIIASKFSFQVGLRVLQCQLVVVVGSSRITHFFLVSDLKILVPFRLNVT
jgi:hypothetical protein